MTTTEFAALPADTVAVLPVAAVEQHGPHLPVYVDACLNEGVVARAIELLPPELPVTFLPMQAVGKSNEHLAFPGTLSLSAETLIRLWTEIGESVHRAGVRKLVLFNSHGGQPQIMDIVARDLRVRLEMFVVCASSYAFGMPVGAFLRRRAQARNPRRLSRDLDDAGAAARPRADGQGGGLRAAVDRARARLPLPHA
jgi:creatinine amidohydrolase